jgi:hypothetical protein
VNALFERPTRPSQKEDAAEKEPERHGDQGQHAAQSECAKKHIRKTGGIVCRFNEFDDDGGWRRTLHGLSLELGEGELGKRAYGNTARPFRQVRLGFFCPRGPSNIQVHPR